MTLTAAAWFLQFGFLCIPAHMRTVTPHKDLIIPNSDPWLGFNDFITSPLLL
jgi:hypothetical protein